MFSRLKKTHQIHKDNVATEPTSKDEREEQENAFSCTNNQDDDAIESLLPDVPMKRPLKCDPRQISNLPEAQRNSIKEDHPEMSEYFFLSQRDKSKYFHLVNQKYSKSIQLSQPPGSAPKKKSISFKTRFEIKMFSKDENCLQVKGKKSWMQLYRAEKKGKLKQKKSKNK